MRGRERRRNLLEWVRAMLHSRHGKSGATVGQGIDSASEGEGTVLNPGAPHQAGGATPARR